MNMFHAKELDDNAEIHHMDCVNRHYFRLVWLATHERQAFERPCRDSKGSGVGQVVARFKVQPTLLIYLKTNRWNVL